MKPANGLIVVSIAVAAVAFLWGPLRWFLYAGSNDIPDSYNLARSVWLGWTWIGTFGTTLLICKWRALWLLLAAPFALYWPAMWIFIGHACDMVGHCGQ
jgi:hypothetical protein